MCDCAADYDDIRCAAETDVSLSTTLPSTAVIVTGEQNQLTYALSHLLDNAYRFTENGAIVITISADDTFATLQVSDTGVGIPETNCHTYLIAFSR